MPSNVDSRGKKMAASPPPDQRTMDAITELGQGSRSKQSPPPYSRSSPQRRWEGSWLEGLGLALVAGGRFIREKWPQPPVSSFRVSPNSTQLASEDELPQKTQPSILLVRWSSLAVILRDGSSSQSAPCNQSTVARALYPARSVAVKTGRSRTSNAPPPAELLLIPLQRFAPIAHQARRSIPCPPRPRAVPAENV